MRQILTFADEQQFAIDSHSMASKIIAHMKRVSAYLNRWPAKSIKNI